MDVAEEQREHPIQGQGASQTVLQLKLEEIQANPYQPRRFFDTAQLEELAESIREYGVMQPVLVRLVEGHYQLISGERRYRASKLAGLDTIPAMVKQLGDKEVAELAMIENLQRADLNYFEEAAGYERLMQEFSMTQDEVAKKMGKSQSAVANKLRLLQLSDAVRKEIAVEVLSERHVRALLKLKEEALQLEVIRRIYQNNYNVKQTEICVQRLLDQQKTMQKQEKSRKTMQTIRDMRIFQNTIKSTVETIRDTGVAAELEERDAGAYVEYVIRLPKGTPGEKKTASGDAQP